MLSRLAEAVVIDRSLLGENQLRLVLPVPCLEGDLQELQVMLLKDVLAKARAPPGLRRSRGHPATSSEANADHLQLYVARVMVAHKASDFSGKRSARDSRQVGPRGILEHDGEVDTITGAA